MTPIEIPPMYDMFNINKTAHMQESYPQVNTAIIMLVLQKINSHAFV
jgi:hypothetical protein